RFGTGHFAAGKCFHSISRRTFQRIAGRRFRSRPRFVLVSIVRLLSHLMYLLFKWTISNEQSNRCATPVLTVAGTLRVPQLDRRCAAPAHPLAEPYSLLHLLLRLLVKPISRRV